MGKKATTSVLDWAHNECHFDYLAFSNLLLLLFKKIVKTIWWRLAVLFKLQRVGWMIKWISTVWCIKSRRRNSTCYFFITSLIVEYCIVFELNKETKIWFWKLEGPFMAFFFIERMLDPVENIYFWRNVLYNKPYVRNSKSLCK